MTSRAILVLEYFPTTHDCDTLLVIELDVAEGYQPAAMPSARGSEPPCITPLMGSKLMPWA